MLQTQVAQHSQRLEQENAIGYVKSSHSVSSFRVSQKNHGGAGDALGSWVALPSSVPEHLPQHVGVALDLRAGTVVVERGAELALPKAAIRGGP